MAYLILSSRRTRQPSGPVRLNAAHPRYASCLFAYPGGQLTGPVLGRANLSATIAGNTTLRTHRYGVGPYLDGTGDWVDLGSSVVLASNTQPFTVAWEETPLGTPPAYALVCAVNAGIHSLTVFHAAAADSTYGRLSAGKSGSFTARKFAGAPAQADGVANRWLLVAKGGIDSTTDADWELYVDGVLYAASAGATTAGTAGVTRIGSGSAGSSTFKGVISNFTFWDSAFSSAEALDWFAYPYGHYDPDPRRIYFGAGGTGATTDAAVAGTQAADVAAIAAEATTGAALAGTQTTDVAAVTAEATTGAALAGTQATDVAAVTVEATTGAAIAGTQDSDVAALVVDSEVGTTTCAIGGTQAPDVAAIDVEATLGLALAATQASDLGYIVVEATLPAAVAATQSSDVAAASVSVGGIWTDVGVSAATWADVGGATSIWTDL